ncbi:uncharacterized protein CCR75_004658 [Bremia lactucae]|uniref:Uncharacterized protein n=1 Tax=Bremia lactucae TaxID=4779 RepID=A0A976FQE9_BRELC|nr:hypothetical protein CCR75_004658 [Bremia lactucae]
MQKAQIEMPGPDKYGNNFCIQKHQYLLRATTQNYYQKLERTEVVEALILSSLFRIYHRTQAFTSMDDLSQLSADAEKEFVKLAMVLYQTANDTIKCLRILKQTLATYDSRHRLHFRSTSNYFIRSDIRVVKGTTTDLRHVAKRISKSKISTNSEINAARLSMNATADAIKDLIQAGRVFDQNTSSGVSITGDSVESVVRSTLNNNFHGIGALKRQIRATEIAMSPSFATCTKNAVVDVANNIANLGSIHGDNQCEHTREAEPTK